MVKYSVQPPFKHKERGISTNFFIRIEEGPYAGVEYTYLQVAHRGVDGDDNMKINFEYDVLHSPVAEVVREDFEAVIWDILKEIIINSIDSVEDEPETVDDLEDEKIEFVPEEIIDFQKPESD